MAPSSKYMHSLTNFYFCVANSEQTTFLCHFHQAPYLASLLPCLYRVPSPQWSFSFTVRVILLNKKSSCITFFAKSFQCLPIVLRTESILLAMFTKPYSIWPCWPPLLPLSFLPAVSAYWLPCYSSKCQACFSLLLLSGISSAYCFTSPRSLLRSHLTFPF